MKIKEITVSKTIQEKQYEPLELMMTASLEEGDDINKTVDDLRFCIDYKLNEDFRDGKKEVIEKELDSGVDAKSGKDLSEVGIKLREDWLAQYNDAQARFHQLDFLKNTE